MTWSPEVKILPPVRRWHPRHPPRPSRQCPSKRARLRLYEPDPPKKGFNVPYLVVFWVTPDRFCFPSSHCVQRPLLEPVDEIGVFLPQVKFIKAYASTKSKQNWTHLQFIVQFFTLQSNWHKFYLVQSWNGTKKRNTYIFHICIDTKNQCQSINMLSITIYAKKKIRW